MVKIHDDKMLDGGDYYFFVPSQMLENFAHAFHALSLRPSKAFIIFSSYFALLITLLVPFTKCLTFRHSRDSFSSVRRLLKMMAEFCGVERYFLYPKRCT